MQGQPHRKSRFLQLSAVTIRVGSDLVFRDTNWHMHADEQWAIVGPNASGKSTLIGAVLGEVPIVQGEIRYHFAEDRGSGPITGPDRLPDGAIASVSVADHRRIVSQAISFHQARWSPIDREPLPTVEDVIRLEAPGASNSALPRITRLLGLDGLLDREIAHLSNGEMRKTLLARALLQRPKLLILDNPFAGLDRGSRRTLMQTLSDLMKTPMRVVVVTQRLDEVPAATTHMLYLEDHTVVLQGRKRLILRQGAGALLASRAGPSLRLPRSRLPTLTKRRGKRRTDDILVRIRNANVTYGKTRILRDVSWTIHAGRHWALLGANGSGKSTLLSLILGDNPQCYANDIEVFGRRPGPGNSVWEIKRRIGWVAPELQYHYQGNVDVHAVVCSGFFDSIGLYRGCTTTQERKVRSWLRVLGLTSQAETPFDRLPDGHQRLALLARALVKSPELLILDEPCQGLDVAHRDVVLDVIDTAVRHTGCTLVYVTHRADEMPRIVSKRLRLKSCHE